MNRRVPVATSPDLNWPEEADMALDAAGERPLETGSPTNPPTWKNGRAHQRRKVAIDRAARSAVRPLLRYGLATPATGVRR